MQHNLVAVEHELALFIIAIPLDSWHQLVSTLDLQPCWGFFWRFFAGRCLVQDETENLDDPTSTNWWVDICPLIDFSLD